MPTDYAVPPPLIQLNQQHQQSMMLQMQKRKAPYAKPIPKEFEKAWKSNLPVTNAPPPSILQMANILIDPITKMPAVNMMQPPPGLSVPPPSMMQPPPNLPSSGNLMHPNLNQPPPLLSPSQENSSVSPPDRSQDDGSHSVKLMGNFI